MGMIQLKHSEIKDIRKEWCEEVDYVCPVLKQAMPLESFTVDHWHALKSIGPVEETGQGCCRGVLSFQANAFEGKVSGAFPQMASG